MMAVGRRLDESYVYYTHGDWNPSVTASTVCSLSYNNFSLIVVQKIISNRCRQNVHGEEEFSCPGEKHWHQCHLWTPSTPQESKVVAHSFHWSCSLSIYTQNVFDFSSCTPHATHFYLANRNDSEELPSFGTFTSRCVSQDTKNRNSLRHSSMYDIVMPQWE